ncbi:MAG TPA: TerB family tellurite resistance protein [Sandaracinaceae bacterium LLY-WYZ-13_1]|nr:TerB family tellurite resistance protein [Sandaracinaceae bacterium LLY-WYZ-13_1]
MELRDLNDDETLIFVGLLREMVQADGEYSDQEKDFVAEQSKALGADRFRQAMEEAKERYGDLASLKEAAKGVERQEARQLIFDRLIKSAVVDGVDEAEEKPLRWLAEHWKIYG